MAKSAPTTEVAPSATATKRLTIIGGGKGGVGKSTFARALCDYYDLKGLSFRPFDGDLENPTLSRFFDDAEPLASQTASGFESLIREMEKGAVSQIVADLGAGTQRHAAEFERMLGIAAAAKEFKYQPVLVWMLAPSKDSIGLLGQAIDAHAKEAGWRFVLAKAIYEHGDWSMWENSETKKKVDQVEPEVFDVPILEAKSFALCDKKDLRFRNADRSALPYIEAAYTNRWFTSVQELLDRSQTLAASAKF